MQDEINHIREDPASAFLLFPEPFEFLVLEGLGIFPGMRPGRTACSGRTGPDARRCAAQTETR